VANDEQRRGHSRPRRDQNDDHALHRSG
jgi:hypothetical protein